MPESAESREPATPGPELRSMPRKVHVVAAWRVALLWPVAALIKVWCRTLRWEFTEADRVVMQDASQPQIVLLWHNRLFAISELFRRQRRGHRLSALVSASRDGAWLTAFFRLMGLDIVRGSRTFRGTQAVRELVRALQEGRDIGITPDGSQGPVYECKEGAALVARLSGAPLVLLSLNFENAWRLRSWDRFYLPKPFSRVRIRLRKYADWRELAGEEGADPGVLARAIGRVLRELAEGCE